MRSIKLIKKYKDSIKESNKEKSDLIMRGKIIRHNRRKMCGKTSNIYKN